MKQHNNHNNFIFKVCKANKQKVTMDESDTTSIRSNSSDDDDELRAPLLEEDDDDYDSNDDYINYDEEEGISTLILLLEQKKKFPLIVKEIKLMNRVKDFLFMIKDDIYDMISDNHAGNAADGLDSSRDTEAEVENCHLDFFQMY
jgi:hypothetical protein